MGFPSLILTKSKSDLFAQKRIVAPSPYNSELINEIARSHAIEAAHHNELKGRLDFAADLYLFRTATQNSRLNNRQIKRRLAKIEGQADKLYKELSNLPQQLDRYCHEAHRAIGTGLWEKEFASVLKRVDYIKRICKGAIVAVLPDDPGRPVDAALYVWVKTMGDYWRNDLRREFTYDEHQQVQITPAGRFLTDCLAPLDNEALSSLGWQMRLYARPETYSQ